jgi:hypothetical protein
MGRAKLEALIEQRKKPIDYGAEPPAGGTEAAESPKHTPPVAASKPTPKGRVLVAPLLDKEDTAEEKPKAKRKSFLGAKK